jgi:hypothetical protein
MENLVFEARQLGITCAMKMIGKPNPGFDTDQDPGQCLVESVDLNGQWGTT